MYNKKNLTLTLTTMQVGRVIRSCRNSGRGISLLVLGEREHSIRVLLAVFVPLCAPVCLAPGCSGDYCLAATFSLLLVFATECTNSVIELVCNRVTRNQDDQIRDIQDMMGAISMVVSVRPLLVLVGLLAMTRLRAAS